MQQPLSVLKYKMNMKFNEEKILKALKKLDTSKLAIIYDAYEDAFINWVVKDFGINQNNLELSTEQKKELDVRIKSFHNDPSMGRSWNEIKNTISR